MSDEQYRLLRAAMEDIAKGRWNSPSRTLDTRGHLSALEYARAALRAENRWAPVTTIHHPKCETVATNDVRDCNCGGVYYQARPVSPADTTEGT